MDFITPGLAHKQNKDVLRNTFTTFKAVYIVHDQFVCHGAFPSPVTSPEEQKSYTRNKREFAKIIINL